MHHGRVPCHVPPEHVNVSLAGTHRGDPKHRACSRQHGPPGSDALLGQRGSAASGSIAASSPVHDVSGTPRSGPGSFAASTATVSSSASPPVATPEQAGALDANVSVPRIALADHRIVSPRVTRRAERVRAESTLHNACNLADASPRAVSRLHVGSNRIATMAPSSKVRLADDLDSLAPPSHTRDSTLRFGAATVRPRRPGLEAGTFAERNARTLARAPRKSGTRRRASCRASGARAVSPVTLRSWSQVRPVAFSPGRKSSHSAGITKSFPCAYGVMTSARRVLSHCVTCPKETLGPCAESSFDRRQSLCSQRLWRRVRPTQTSWSRPKAGT